MDLFSAEFFARFLGVLVIDLILSGDNAVVIALAVRSLEGSTRRRAIFWGAMAAVAMRLLFAAVVTYLLLIPFLQAVAALLLVWIAWRLLFQEDDHSNVRSGGNLWQAIRIIVIADVVMSLDNVVALVGVSGGGREGFILLVFGLLLTIPLIVYGARILSSLMDRLPWLVYLGSGVLIFVAVELFLEDDIIHNFLDIGIGLVRIIALVAALAFIAFGYYKVRQMRNTPKPAPRVK